MLTALALLSAGLFLLAACDRRTWPFLGVIVLAWLTTWALDASLPVLAALAGRLFVDAIAAFLAWGVEGRARPYARWMTGVRATFVMMLLAHGAFWFARNIGVDIWPAYAHGLNAVAVAQLAVLAAPGGWSLVGKLGRMAGSAAGLASIASARGRTAYGEVAAPPSRNGGRHG